MLNGELFNFYTISALSTAKVLSFIEIGSSRSTTIWPDVSTCTDTVINFKLKIVSSWPSSKVRNIKSDDKLKVLSCDSCEVFGDIISIYVLSCELHCTACESVCCWGCKAIKRQSCRRLKISEEDRSLVFRDTGIVWVCEVFILEDGIGTDIAAVLSSIETGCSWGNTVRMAEIWA